ncbi:hypothetical protein SH501x_004322 [Pirellulaceae bacterium SH501]
MNVNCKLHKGDTVTISPHEVYYQESSSVGHTLFGGDDFTICVEDLIVEDQILIGVIGNVTSKGTFNGLVCSAMKRFDGDKWSDGPTGGTNFKIGRTRVTRDSNFEANHPFGTKIDYPFYAGIGIISFTNKN